MSSYILKSNKEKNEILLYQEKSSYSFSPKKGYKEVKKITILDPEMLNTLWEHKLDKEYSKLLKLIYSLVSNDDTTSTDVLIAYTEIERIKESIEKMNDLFINRIYTEKEIEYCEARGKQKYQHYAARFASKEAVFKAISIKLQSKYQIEWKDIEIINDENLRPAVNLKKKVEGINNIDISISHCKEYAVAMVVVTCEG